MDVQRLPNFSMLVPNGYSLRNTFSIIDTEAKGTTVGMKLSPEGIEICFVTESKCGIHKIVLRGEEMQYNYDIRDDQGRLLPEYIIGFDTKRMSSALNCINRKDAVQIYWLRGQNFISISPQKTGAKTGSGALFVPIHVHEYHRIDFDKNFAGTPDFRVQSKEFAESCKQARECSYMEFYERDNVIFVQGIMPDKTVFGLKKYPKSTQMVIQPQIDENVDLLLKDLRQKIKIDDGGEIKSLSLSIAPSQSSIKIDQSVVKALAKIHNVSTPDTMLKFYFNSRGGLKLVSPIGNYGTYSIFLKNQ